MCICSSHCRIFTVLSTLTIVMMMMMIMFVAATCCSRHPCEFLLSRERERGDSTAAAATVLLSFPSSAACLPQRKLRVFTNRQICQSLFYLLCMQFSFISRVFHYYYPSYENIISCRLFILCYNISASRLSSFTILYIDCVYSAVHI